MSLVVVIPNWNGEDFLKECLDSLLSQTTPLKIVVVDNGSEDNSLNILESYSDIHLIKNDKNEGFSGGVNAGIKWVLNEGYEYIALLNNDAVVETDWLDKLAETMRQSPEAGIVTSKILARSGTIDSTGECYSIWAIPFPRGRGEVDRGQYDEPKDRSVLAASGGASLYRAEMLQKVGLFDESYFAYYEDVDISIRAQLAGWKVIYEPSAIVHHYIGGTSEKLGDFRLYHMYKNFWFLYLKNIPNPLFIKYLPRFIGVFIFKLLQLIKSLKLVVLVKVLLVIIYRLPEMLIKRLRIQRNKKVDYRYIDSCLYHGPPPSQPGLVKIVSKLGIK